MSDLDVFIVAWVNDDGMHHGCAINPDFDTDREFGALGWCAQMVTHIEDHGFERAMEMGAWQRRADGQWQLWARAVQLPSLD